MASRLGLGCIIEWAKNADAEEVAYALVRITQIAKERAARVDGADAAGKVKRTRRAKVRVVHTDESARLDAPGADKAASA